MTERQIFGDGTPYAFFLNKDGMWQRNPNYKPLLTIHFEFVSLLFVNGSSIYVQQISNRPVFSEHFIPFSEN